MKKGDAVILVMKKCLLANGMLDDKKYACRIVQYDVKREALYLALENDALPAISLDALYECNIKDEAEVVSCMGRIRERYENQHGKILKLKIKNGFYKINVNTVDK